MSEPDGWRVLGERVAVDNAPWLRTRELRVDTGSGHAIDRYYVHDYPDWVNVVAVTGRGTVLVNRQWRQGAGRVIDELPSGTIDEGEDPRTTALRELREETGFAFASCEQVARYSPNPANHTNVAYGFLARGGRQAGEQELEDSESIAVREVSVDEFARMTRAGQWVNAMHQATAWAALARLGV